MSGMLLESESDHEDSEISSGYSENGRLMSQDPLSLSTGNVMQSRLEQYSKRLSQLGLAATDGDSNGDGTDNDIIPSEYDEEEISVPKQEVPMTTSLILDKLPPTTNEFLHQLSIKEMEQDIEKTVHKIQIKFQPIGSIPLITPSVCTISSQQTFSMIILFLKKRLKVEQVFCYINNSFAPNPQQTIGSLWSQFKVNDELIVSYCGTVAFG
ncbi:hypothetical protein Kpol_534p48 [Vanderwaltozyma polyspora DSM 70294]|uniref:Ubiquitin-like protein ATG12 n=1 Tax=Vanderwaltozyma polyspora (strain ATCC 22028 / DSM 70294 / BCRC 21397 / CBS 2163 / NBRC 10782 / NRRL Y-8283 / UCD 57-17) TaxID=436907 RepID=ATG12_VANPO|nr:uncharacterized protein Kpol_534p48 [Vanderwaltozyma polyspora DSM 70294]A7TJM4.1 RecName: Full=Ubiquitin-like protein ATG12; AltName: Full=Autophagy-related protein 12 [Vanderwaltozyma polyspora DSM 70294]EDO17567.1 hypothetical protein Kpol_534p48 [Vanderwaltozyma polyspora DSM 70294]